MKMQKNGKKQENYYKYRARSLFPELLYFFKKTYYFWTFFKFMSKKRGKMKMQILKNGHFSPHRKINNERFL